MNSSTNVLEEGLKELGKQLKSQQKAITQAQAAERDEDVNGLQAALASIDREVLTRLGLGDTADATIERARSTLKRLRQEQRRALAADLKAACEAAGRRYQRLGDSPPELLIAPFTAVLDLESMQARVLYAREDLVTTRATAADIMKTIEQQEKRLGQRQQPPDEVLAQLYAAYLAVLGQIGGRLGDRIELLELLPLMAIAQQSARWLADPVQERYRSYTKARFLWDLARLRATRNLEHNGMRLDLGTATGDSTRRPARVFFIDDGAGQGQYYLSLRFVKV